MRALAVVAVLATAAMAIPLARAAECGSQAGGATCLSNLCCSQYGWCGSTPEYCGVGCQSGCGGGGGGGGTPVTPVTPIPIPGGGVSSIVSRALFNQMLLHRSSQGCETQGFYTYDAFITAAADFPGFGTTGGTAARKRELAAFLAQTSHETTGGWPTAPNGPYSWGYCFINERDATSNYCTPSMQWPCAPGQSYHGRGPLQLSHNYNYGAAGRALGADLLGNPGLVATDPILSFKTAMWFWMTAQPPKPSSHEVIMGYWTPSAADQAAGRVPGFGVITNIVNGGKECGRGYDHRVADRIGFYKRYCLLFGVSPGNNLDCYHQEPFPGVFT